MDNTDKSKRVARNTLFMFIRMILVMSVGLYTSRVIVAALGVVDFGVYNVVGSVVVSFSFLKQALTNSTYRFLAYDLENPKSDVSETFSTAMNTHLILALITFVICETLGLWFLHSHIFIPEGREFAADIAYQFSILCFCIQIIQTPYNSAIIAHEKMDFYAYTSIVEVLLRLAIVFALSYISFDGLILFSFLTLLVSIIIFFWYYACCKRSFSECNYRKCWNTGLMKKMVGYSGWSLLVNGADVSVNQSFVFFFNSFFGVVANAALGIATQVNNQLVNFLNSFTQSYNPLIIKSYAAKDYKYFLSLLFSTSKLSYFLLLLISVPIMLNMDFILQLWLKTPPEGTSQFLIVIICYSLIDAYSAPLWIGVHATGDLRNHQILISSIKILNIPIAYLMLKMGLPAWTVLLVKTALNFVCSVARPCYVKFLYGLPLYKYFKEVLLVVFLVTLIVLPLPMFLSDMIDDPVFKLLYTSISFFLVFVPVVYFVGLNQKERNMLFELVGKKLFPSKNCS